MPGGQPFPLRGHMEEVQLRCQTHQPRAHDSLEGNDIADALEIDSRTGAVSLTFPLRS